MMTRFVMTAALLMSATAGSAQPAQDGTHDTRGQSRPAQVMLASADRAATPAPTDQSASAPVKHRSARVTTCRCGDQVADPSEENPDQE